MISWEAAASHHAQRRNTVRSGMRAVSGPQVGERVSRDGGLQSEREHHCCRLDGTSSQGVNLVHTSAICLQYLHTRLDD